MADGWCERRRRAVEAELDEEEGEEVVGGGGDGDQVGNFVEEETGPEVSVEEEGDGDEGGASEGEGKEVVRGLRAEMVGVLEEAHCVSDEEEDEGHA